MSRAETRLHSGVPCAACSVVLGITEQLAQIHNETTPAAMERLCEFLPLRLQTGCDIAAEYVAPFILDVISNTTSPDTLCYDMGVCYAEPGKTMCHLFPLPRSLNEVDHDRERGESLRLPPREYVDLALADSRGWPWICYIPGVYYLCEAFDDVYDQLLPAVDFDGDRFSPAETLRGSIWRGRDCNDFDREVYPGVHFPHMTVSQVALNDVLRTTTDARGRRGGLQLQRYLRPQQIERDVVRGGAVRGQRAARDNLHRRFSRGSFPRTASMVHAGDAQLADFAELELRYLQ